MPHFIVSIFLIVALGVAPARSEAAAATFEDGLAVYDRAVASRDPMHAGFREALVIWEPLAEQGDAGAAYHVGLIYYFGAGGVPIDQTLGIRRIREGAEGGYATAQAFLGLLAEEGDGVAVRRSEEDALDWYRKAAESGQCAGVKRLAHAYEHGELGLTADAAEAARWQGRVEGCSKR